ncbi:D-alanyl-D-alanine carboxypeptidase family protein [Clostridium gasigenes]|uniref:D-alanyl-D-alanine carboxypeptidase family protein n=1 Tax=Clostridium gasigenes TaxID=94869 RepID=UPI003C2B6BBE
MNLKKTNILKSLALALSISLLAPLANKVTAETNNVPAPNVTGQSALTMDLGTGEVIYSKNADVKSSLASTTKLLTGLLFAESKAKTDKIPFTASAATQDGGVNLAKYKKINIGETLTADDVMEALLIYSANDTAYMIADSVSGNVESFVSLMNERVKELGLKDTNFINPNGLESLNPNKQVTDANYTTAYDLAVIAKEAFKNDWVRETLAPKTTPASINITGSPVPLETRNKNLGIDGNIGGKTGTEELAGHCFVGYYEQDGRQLVTVVLGSEYGADGMNVFHDTSAIAKYGYDAQKEIYKKSNEEVGTVDLEYKLFRFFGPSKKITAPIVLSQDVNYYKNDLNDKTADISYKAEDKNAWQVTGGTEVPLTFTTIGHTEEVKGTVKVSASDLLKSNLTFYLAILLIIVIITVLLLLISRIINMRKRKRNRKRNRY